MEMFDWLHSVILFGIQRPVIVLGRCRLELFFIQVCRGFFFTAMVGYIFLGLFYQRKPMSTETQRRFSSHEIPQATSMVNLLLSEINKENLLDRTKTIIGRRCWKIKKKINNVGKKKKSWAQLSGKACSQKSVRYEKYYWPALMENKNIAQCRSKNKHSSARISGEVCAQISIGCSLRPFWAIAFLFNPLIIFGWCWYEPSFHKGWLRIV